MQRVPEPELMDDPAQALAYHKADFSASHGRRVDIFRTLFPTLNLVGAVLDLGCGSGDVLFRFARAFPEASFTGLDGSEPMLALARGELEQEPGLRRRVTLVNGLIPDAALAPAAWQLIMSHSLLHQLHQPEVLWRMIRRLGQPGTAVFVADLRRPGSTAEAARLVETTSAGEPEVLRQDFYNSLCAAFEPEEVRAQLDAAGLGLQVQPEAPAHLVIHGIL